MTIEAVTAALNRYNYYVDHRHTVDIDKETKEMISDSARKCDQLLRKAGDIISGMKVKPLTWWQHLALKVETAILACAIFFFTICGCIYYNSPQYWGKRFYDVCNHPLQSTESVLKFKGCAYEIVIREFGKDGADKELLKQKIREEEAQLKRQELEKTK